MGPRPHLWLVELRVLRSGRSRLDDHQPVALGLHGTPRVCRSLGAVLVRISPETSAGEQRRRSWAAEADAQDGLHAVLPDPRSHDGRARLSERECQES